MAFFQSLVEFIETVFQKKFTTPEKEKQFLLDYLKICNRI